MKSDYNNVDEILNLVFDLDKLDNKTEMLYHLTRLIHYTKLDNDIDKLDYILNVVNFDHISEQLIVSILRSLFTHRTLIKEYKNKVLVAYDELQKRELDAQSLLRGLC